MSERVLGDKSVVRDGSLVPAMTYHYGWVAEGPLSERSRQICPGMDITNVFKRIPSILNKYEDRTIPFSNDIGRASQECSYVIPTFEISCWSVQAKCA